MNLSLSKKEIVVYVRHQLDLFFPDHISSEMVGDYMDECLERVEFCFDAVCDQYFKDGTDTMFNHLNSDHYAMFLYFLSRSIHVNGGDPRICAKIFGLNKFLTGINVYFTTELPDIFLFVHPIGTILGRATYSNYFLVYQNCTVGSNHDEDYPVMGEHVALYSGASVLGKSTVGNNVKVSAGSMVMDQDIPDSKIFVGSSNDYALKTCRHHDRIWDSE